jgi:teichuronic acid biosynthesis glycosyltransferase TuaG
MLPLVSIITPTYNCENFIQDTIVSVLNQTFSNWELILIDDCSSDGTFDTLKTYEQKDNRIKVLKSTENVGPGEIRNIGIRHAKGRYLSFLDGDDIWLPEKLEKHLKYIEKHKAPISFTSYTLINDNGDDINKKIQVRNEKLFFKDYLKDTIIGCSTAIIDRDIIKDVAFKKMKSRVDTLLWITLLKQGYWALGYDENLVKYRVHKNSVSANKVKAAKKVWSLYRDELKFSLIKSSYYFVNYAIRSTIKHIY